MRWAILAALLVSQAAIAQWVQFDACGFLTDAVENIDTSMMFKPAPHLGPVWIWVPSIAMITALNEKTAKDSEIVHCSRLHIAGNSVIVLGRSDEIKRKIAEARGY